MRIYHILKKLYYELLPYHCVLCHSVSKRTQDLCEPCFAELPILTHSCERCARKVPVTLSQTCGECLRKPPPFDGVYALFVYQDCIKRLILSLKFNGRLIHARILGELLVPAIRKWYALSSWPDVIIPMPLHPKRIRERGFNQALEIARPIAKLLDLPIDSTSCQRIRHTVAQAMLPAEKRKENMKNAFLIKKDFVNQHIVILDDVVTTCSTVTELAKALKAKGANRVDIWCCARA